MTDTKNPELISSKKLMGLIGFLAFLLPILVYAMSAFFDDCMEIQSTISTYYHTEARNGFVGILCALSFAFFCYVGYDKKDNIIGNIAAILCLGVAFFPTNNSAVDSSVCTSIFEHKILGIVHYVSAILLFMTLAYFAFFQFTKSKNGSCFIEGHWDKLEPQKKKDNAIYIFCGIIIVVCIFTIGIYHFIISSESEDIRLSHLKPVFFLESIMIWSFGFAWLRKSKFFRKEIS